MGDTNVDTMGKGWAHLLKMIVCHIQYFLSYFSISAFLNQFPEKCIITVKSLLARVISDINKSQHGRVKNWKSNCTMCYKCFKYNFQQQWSLSMVPQSDMLCIYVQFITITNSIQFDIQLFQHVNLACGFSNIYITIIICVLCFF